MNTEHHRLRDRQFKAILHTARNDTKRDLSMAGNPRYQPDELKPYFGYDQWVLWLTVVEIVWLNTLYTIGYAPELGEFFNGSFSFYQLFKKLRTRDQDRIERQPDVGHDINALLVMLRQYLPDCTHRYLHHGLTSYDTIDTARSLMFITAFFKAYLPLAEEVDRLWRQKIAEAINIIRLGRTHLRNALPQTMGLWLSVIHHRFREVMDMLTFAANSLVGKASGAVGSHAATAALFRNIGKTSREVEKYFVEYSLGLATAPLSTQILPPERLVNYLFDHTLMSGVMAQLGNDVRILQSSAIGEIMTVGSTSSTMAHKTNNPIAAEQLAGMHSTVLAEFMKPLLNLTSDLERDLRGSSPSRDYPAVVVYNFHQLKTAERLFGSMSFNENSCQQNFDKSKYMIMGELLYLLLAKVGLPNAHTFVNKTVVPVAKEKNITLVTAMEIVVREQGYVRPYWQEVSKEYHVYFEHPETYIGEAERLAREELENSLV